LRLRGVTAGKAYYLAVDGLNGATGMIPVACQLGQEPPVQTGPPPIQSVPAGNATVLRAPTVAGSVITYQWLRDGIPVAGATGPELPLQPANASANGIYSVIIDTGIGRVTNAIIQLSVQTPLSLGNSASIPPARFEGEELVIRFNGSANQQIAVDQGQDVTDW